MYCVLTDLLLPGLVKPLAIFFSPPAQLIRELLHEGQVLSVGVSAESGLGGRWLARIRQLIKEGSVPDVSLVPVGISYDCVTKTNVQVPVCKHTHTHLIGAICHCYALKSNRADLGFQTVKEGNVRQEIWHEGKRSSLCWCSVTNRRSVMVVWLTDLAYLSNL